MRKRKLVAVWMATLLGLSSMFFSLPTTVRATSEFQNEQMSGAQNNVKAKKIYVQTLAGGGGDGTETNPYSDFKTAYNSATAGDTIVLLNSVTIQNDDNGSDKSVFTFDKAITLEGIGSQSALNVRVPVQLKANIVLTKTDFLTSKVYLNGYSLTMEEVKTNYNNQKRVTVYGGSYQGTNQSGNKSSLIVRGFVQNPFEFESIYAGSESGPSNIPVSIELHSGAKVLQSIDASGVNDKVHANVDFFIGDVNVSTFQNTNKTIHTTLYFQNYINQNGPIIDGYQNVKLENSKIKEKGTDLTSISGTLELVGNSVLDISERKIVLETDKLSSEAGSRMVLNQDSGQVKVNNQFTGTLELRTPGVDTQTSGSVKLDWPYLEASLTSTGKVVFHPFVTQQNVEVHEVVTTVKQWVMKEKVVGNAIDSIQMVEGNKVDLLVPVHEFTLKALDQNKNPIQYTPDYDIQLKDKNGDLVPEDKIEVFYDWNDEKMSLFVNDQTIDTGIYTLVIREKVAGKTFELSLLLYRTGEPLGYSVLFDANGGTGNMSMQSVDIGSTVTLHKNTFVKEGHTFKGWSTTQNGNVEYADEQAITNLIMPGEMITLYAVWELNRYDVIFDSQGGSLVNNQLVEYHAFVKEPANPTKPGYIFDGWYTEAECKNAWNFNVNKMPSRNLTLYAKWVLTSLELNGAPTIHATDKVLTVGDTFNPLDGVTAYDREDGNISLTDINIIANDVNMDKAGTYTVTYKVTDSAGISTVKTINITVKEKLFDIPVVPENPQQPNVNQPSDPSHVPQTGDMSNIGLFGSMLVGSTGVLAVLLEKKRKKK